MSKNRFSNVFRTDEILKAGKPSFDDNKNENIANDNSVNTSVNDSIDENVNIDVNTSVNNNTSIDTDSHVSINEDVPEIDFDTLNEPNSTTKNSAYVNTENNKLVIGKVVNTDKIVRMTYYLKKSQIEKINKIAKATDYPKSEVVQMLLDFALKNVVIDE